MTRLLLSYILFWVSNTFATDALHLILVADTDAPKIGLSIADNALSWQQEANEISYHTGLELHLHFFQGCDVNAQFLEVIEGLEVKENDVILFTWSGHGFRTKEMDEVDNPWPIFNFVHESARIDHLAVTELLMRKNPRLLISLADTCNEYYPSVLKRADGIPFQSQIVLFENYVHLFLESKGLVMATAAEPGQYAYYWVPRGGGCFTQILLATLHQAKTHLTWDDLFLETKEKLAHLGKYKKQQPHYQVQLIE